MTDDLLHPGLASILNKGGTVCAKTITFTIGYVCAVYCYIPINAVYTVCIPSTTYTVCTWCGAKYIVCIPLNSCIPLYTDRGT